MVKFSLPNKYFNACIWNREKEEKEREWGLGASEGVNINGFSSNYYYYYSLIFGVFVCPIF
jgi:hypothetical protein